MHKSSLLDPKHRLLEHIVVLVLVVAIIILTGIDLNMGIRVTRAEIMLIPFVSAAASVELIEADAMSTAQGVKSIIFIGYQLLGEHTTRFARWKSLKVNAILNCIEVVVWLAAIFLKFIGITISCFGSSCAVNWIITVTAFAIL